MSNAMQKIAKKMRITFVDAYKPSLQWYKGEDSSHRRWCPSE